MGSSSTWSCGRSPLMSDLAISIPLRKVMFISRQTYEGLQITIHSFKDVCVYLLEQGIPYILSEKFCLDDLENYFGRQRAIGHRRDNPNMRDVRYNDNSIKSQFSVRPIAGNVTKNVMTCVIDNSPLPKRKRVRVIFIVMFK